MIRSSDGVAVIDIRVNKIPHTLRASVPEDEAFIVDSWLMSFRTQPIAQDMGSLYMRSYKWLIRELLKRCAVLVATPEDDPDTILGWAATHQDTVLYTFVKKDVRRGGIAKSLLAPFLTRKDIVVTHRTRAKVTLPEGWVYDPIGNVRVLLSKG